MRIGVVSDTHFQHVSAGLDAMERLCAGPFAGVDLVLHAGDLVKPELLDLLVDPPILAVRGNCDPAHPDLPLRRVLEFDGVRIGMLHGWGPSGDLLPRVLAEFDDVRLDVLVYGHSHHPCCELIDGVLCLNPGSPTDRRKAPFHSVGLLELGEVTRGRIINLDAASGAA